MTSCIGPEILKIPIQVYDQEVFLQMKVVPSVVKKKKKENAVSSHDSFFVLDTKDYGVTTTC